MMIAGVVLDARTPILRGHVERSARWVVFLNVHPAFAAAVEEQTRSTGPAAAGAGAG